MRNKNEARQRDKKTRELVDPRSVSRQELIKNVLVSQENFTKSKKIGYIWPICCLDTFKINSSILRELILLMTESREFLPEFHKIASIVNFNLRPVIISTLEADWRKKIKLPRCGSGGKSTNDRGIDQTIKKFSELSDETVTNHLPQFYNVSLLNSSFTRLPNGLRSRLQRGIRSQI